LVSAVQVHLLKRPNTLALVAWHHQGCQRQRSQMGPQRRSPDDSSAASITRS